MRTIAVGSGVKKYQSQSTWWGERDGQDQKDRINKEGTNTCTWLLKYGEDWAPSRSEGLHISSMTEKVLQLSR